MKRLLARDHIKRPDAATVDMAAVLAGNCREFRRLPDVVKFEYRAIVSVLPALLAAPKLLAACRENAPGCGVSTKVLYERVRSFRATQSWVALINRRSVGKSLWRLSRKTRQKDLRKAIGVQAPSAGPILEVRLQIFANGTAAVSTGRKS